MDEKWEADMEHWDGGPAFGLWIIRDEGHTIVAEVPADGPDQERVARLVAACPRMMAVLKALVDDDDIAQGFGGLYAHLNKLRDMARPVIAEAEGE